MHELVTDSVFLVGGGSLSDGSDCLVYALDLGDLVLIDCGAGKSWPRLCENMRSAGLDPQTLHSLILTHCHVDHIGAAAQAKEETGCQIVAHELDAPAIRTGDSKATAASWYGVSLPETPIDVEVKGEGTRLRLSRGSIELLHCPGHTPGSMAALVEVDSQRILFGQDVHGPFNEDFGSDLQAWEQSMRALIELEADVLCEGHYGIMRPSAKVRQFIEGQLKIQGF